ncbi:MAG: P-loop NTPase [archaeon]|nr:P-loop NTPase [archaeon]
MVYRLGIVSGKGGVGKTSITASIACALKKKGINLIAADTDVDAPNLEILFRATGSKIDSFQTQTTKKARFVNDNSIDDNCFHCKKCITEKFCNFDAISWNEDEEIPIIDIIACEGCNACQWLCPASSFIVEPVNSGTITHLKSEYGFSVITGETILGAQTSGKLVTELKQYANEIAEKQNIDFMIIDGPPGIGCPVIASIADLDYVIVIIEPTSAALHDAERVIHLINNFEIKFGVIINKADMWKEGYEKVMEFINIKDIELLGKINLDSQWPLSIAKGLPIIKHQPEGESAKNLTIIAEKIKNLYNKNKINQKLVDQNKHEIMTAED